MKKRLARSFSYRERKNTKIDLLCKRSLCFRHLRIFAIILGVALFVAYSPAYATITNGENAIDELGEFNSPSVDTTAVYTKSCYNAGASSLGFTYPSGGIIDATNHWLFMADGGNNRILVFPLNTNNTLASKTASYVLGQADFVHCAINQNGSTTPSSSSINMLNGSNPVPINLAVDPTNQLLYVPDGGNGRVLVFSTASMSNGEAASYVLGPNNFTTGSSGTSQSLLKNPQGVALDTTHNLLYVADTGNNRVMVYATPVSNGENATYVLGQSSWVAATAATTQSGLSSPEGVTIDIGNNFLYVADYGNNRVMVFSTSGITSNENASYELGQASGVNQFTTRTAATTQAGLNTPVGVTIDTTNNRLFVSENGNNRITVFNTTGISNGENASYVLGQTNFTSAGVNYNGGGRVGFGTCPGMPIFDATNNLLYGPDFGNPSSTQSDNRVLIFDVTPTSPTIASTTTSADSCAIAGGYLYCWGYNNYGEAGVAGGGSFNTPQQVGTATNWTAISQADYNFDAAACGIAGGALYCWGHNTNGELGLGNTTQFTTPQQVGTDTTWTAISQGGEAACGIDSGKLYCWGLNQYGEVGQGNTTQYKTPTQVGVATNWTAISQGGLDTCGIAGGALYCWGYNHFGEAGQNNTTGYKTPTQVGVATNWIAVSQGASDTCGIQGTGSSGALYCWGYNHYGELGLGNTTEYNTPQAVGASISTTGWSAVSIQYDLSNNGDACGVVSGALYCWGLNGNGELGLGNTTQYKTPQQVGVAATWTAVNYDYNNTCGILGGALSCWGYNHQGSNGVGNTTQNTSPQAVSGIDAILNGEDAVDLLGEYSSNSSTATIGWTQYGFNNGPSALGFFNPGAVTLDPVHHQLFVSDQQNNRVLVYTLSTDNSIPTTSGGHTAAYVIGQNSLQGPNTNGRGAGSQYGPFGLTVDTVNGRLFVADELNERILVYNLPISSNAQNAAGVLGETSYTYAGGGTSSTVLNNPIDVAYDSANQNLYVADSANNRVLIFNVPPGFTNGEAASYEFGQPSGASQFTTSASASTQSGMKTPTCVSFDPVNSRLFVCDQNNNRVLVFSTASLSNGPNATNVIGQTNFTNNSAAASQTGLNLPMGASYDTNNNRLFVLDSSSNRIMVYNAGPSVLPTNTASAAFVLGQANFTTASGTTPPTQSTIKPSNHSTSSYNQGLKYDPGSGRLFVPDGFNNRVMIFEGSAISTNQQKGFIPGYD